MQCGLLKLSRLLRDRARRESRSAPEAIGPARARCDRGPHRHPAGDGVANGGKGEREFSGWTVPVDNFS